jgi:DNA-binding NarL/FixJ family response regulator
MTRVPRPALPADGRGLEAPPGLVAERFDVDGVEFVAFTWGSAPDVSALTSAERAVLEHLITGASNEAIARARRTAARTVSNQVAAILRKLRVGSRYELIARFAGFEAP